MTWMGCTARSWSTIRRLRVKISTQTRLASFLAAVLWSAFLAPAQASPTESEAAPSSASTVSIYHGGLISPILPKPVFVLTDTSGARYDFRTETQGYVTLLFFGYAHCPDVCPTQLHRLARALKMISPGMADQVKVVFVTTDPDQDTRTVLRSFLDQFDKRFVGLTGSQEAVDAAQRAANIPVARKTGVQVAGVSEVGHAAFVIAYTKDNFAHVIYPDGVQQDDWVHDLPHLTRETWDRM